MESLQVFYDFGEGFLEKESRRFPFPHRTQEIPVPPGCHSLRLDPGELPIGFSSVTLSWPDGSPVSYDTNGVSIGGRVYFGLPDPQFVIREIPEGQTKLLASMILDKTADPTEIFLDEIRRQNNALAAEAAQYRQELDLCREKIRQMENTKVWKLYRKIKPE